MIVEAVRPVAGLTGSANYLRNSVKAVVDAYDGTVELYVQEPDDPLIQAWSTAFPDIFSDVDEATPQLREHFRYPEDLFRVQSQIYNTYHMNNAREFYAKEDAWSIPRDAALQSNLGASSTASARPLRPGHSSPWMRSGCWTPWGARARRRPGCGSSTPTAR